MALEKEDIEALQATVAAAVTAGVAPLYERLNAPLKKADEPPPAEKVWTASELQDLVDKNQITAAQAQDQLERQRTAQTERVARETARQEAEAARLRGTVDQQLTEYESLFPDVLKDGSAERAKVRRQYDYLVGIGQPATKATELVALGMVYGPLESVRAARKGRNRTDSHEDVGGGDPGGRDDRDDDGEAPPADLKLSKDEKRYYQQGIEKGIYKDWAAVRDERKFAKTRPGRARAH
ncbi:MAG: hypothetical protein AB7Q01_14095 [Gammaproteobacteria bacterium]